MAAPPARPSKSGAKPWIKGQADDLASLASLDEVILLGELQYRYNEEKIYTYVGDILVAINPFRNLNVYNEAIQAKYQDAVKSANPPHIYAIADQAYFSMRRTGADQCAVISGESGAGKTESAKHMIKQIIRLCHTGSDGAALERKILQVNPLLEAFGNAKTLMNDNSSRFGKYTELKFDGRGAVMGAHISEYLLEKSRVVRQNKGERNFHVFYYMFASPHCKQLGLTSTKDFAYTKTTEPGRDLPRMYAELVQALDEVGFSGDEQQCVHESLALVLHLGNLAFDPNADPAQISSPPAVMQKICELLGCDEAAIRQALLFSIQVTRGETIKKTYSGAQALDCRDAFAKALYGRLFGWICSQVNELLAPGMAFGSAAATKEKLYEIGILDIFGFEQFARNGFEQLCINTTNEQLQNFFNQHIFKTELEEYKREGIDGSKISYVDNQLLLDMFFAKPTGLYVLLDEESHFPKATSDTLTVKLHTNLGKCAYYKAPRGNTPTFTLKHYAGDVEYSCDEFLEKNRDTLAPLLIELAQTCRNAVISDIFSGEVTATGAILSGRKTRVDAQGRIKAGAENQVSKRSPTVGAQFTVSLKILMEKMLSCQAHFVRCIKPNMNQAPNNFIDDFVNTQLRYTGMLETTRIRREGYSYRPDFAMFMERFGLLAYGAKTTVTPSATTCSKAMAVSGLQGWLMGKTKVFLKYWHVEQLDKQIRIFHTAAVKIQARVRGFLAKRLRKRMLVRAKQDAATASQMLQDLSRGITQIAARQTSTNAQDAKRKQTGEAPRRPPPAARKPSIVIDKSKSPEELKREASILWWKEKERPRGAGMDLDGNFMPWFHGLISRIESERLLKARNSGSFMVRVSENRFGYTLSYRIKDRCRHYIVEQDARGRYALVGVSKIADSLNALVNFFQRNKINEDGDMLRDPCGQEVNADGEEQCNYGELLPVGQKGYKAEGAAPPLPAGKRAAMPVPGAAAATEPPPPPVSRGSKPSFSAAAPPLPAGGPPPMINRGTKPK